MRGVKDLDTLVLFACIRGILFWQSRIVSASSDSPASRGPQPRTLVLGERSEIKKMLRLFFPFPGFVSSASLWFKGIGVVANCQLLVANCNL